ncbi:MAG: hypothetical protein QNJ72_18285 [Pleurocapsa sp. MO_226.B13]|nr:hypothetical protein [Pleurocapsa sp. MO_226.B13]
MATPTSVGDVSQVDLTGFNEINSLIYGTKWGGITGTVANLTYSFGDPSSSLYISRDLNNTLNPHNPNARYGFLDEPFVGTPDTITNEQKIAVTNILDNWSEIANINWV